MPTYVLQGNGDVTVGVGAVTIQVVALGETGPGRIAVALTRAGSPVDGVIAPRPGMLVVPMPSGRSVVRVSPVGAAAFPAGTVLGLALVVDERLPDPDRIVLANVDVSGLPHRDLATLEVTGAKLTARAAAVESAAVLSELATAARIATREILSIDRVGPDSAVNVSAVVDGSASLEPRWRDGTLAALLEVLLGVADVVAADRSVDAALVTDGVEFLPQSAHADLVVEMTRLRGTARLSTGADLGDAALFDRHPGEATVTYLVSDDVISSAVRQPAPTDRRHPVVLLERRAFELLGPSGLPTTHLEPVTAGQPAAARLVHDADELRRLVRSLLSGVFAPGTPHAERIAR
jgi:hypothetical protein